ncbi:MAG: pantoate--beta-alanine ligase [Bacteroidota bacterium]|nr:pantoate--beta-alanine ligase [Bacteroidota bacterium]
MIIFKDPHKIRQHLESLQKKGLKIGYVPTMGALHPGHISLVNQCRQTCDVTLCSIFVNPVQFNNSEDFKNYPSTLESDILLLEESGCDLLFLPGETDIYPDSSFRNKHYELGNLEQVLEGKFRPGHFQGVCLVVERLLTILQPDDLFLGQKDFQQCKVISLLLHTMGRPPRLHVCPIVRETDGLAMSSRNLRLNPEERALAPQIFKNLTFLKEHLREGNLTQLQKEAVSRLETLGFKVEYLELCNTENLDPLNRWSPGLHGVILVAAFIGKIRLIDNLLL